MDEITQSIVLKLIQDLSFVMILAYLLTRIPALGDFLNRRYSLANRLFLGLLFGLVSVYGTLSAVEIFGVLLNFRDLGPTIAGLLAGPLAGGIAGLIGGAHRYLLGGLTDLPCSVATVAAGLIGGGFHLWKRGRRLMIVEAVFLMAAIEILHVLVITPAIIGLSEEVQLILRTSWIPMILVNSIGIAIFFFILHNLDRERRMEAEKHRIDSELRIAREIQTGMLPTAALTGDPRYTVHAVLKPAKEVGGDLYNFFTIDGERLLLAIGDVAGKGVSASLHMAITQKLIKALARTDEGPARLLGRLNRELCEGNETMTFVTLFVAYCNVRTGETVFSNGGHNPPYLIRGGEAGPLDLESGLALGIRDKAVYTDQRLQLTPGDTLFLYTDGVSEAMNDHEELFGNERLKASLSRLHALPPEAVCNGVLNDLDYFVGQHEQSDDITMTALRFSGDR